MKKPDLTTLLAAATLFLAGGAALPAQEAPPPPPGPPADLRAEVIKQFDRNGDGRLDAAERAEARAAFEQKHPALARAMKGGPGGQGAEFHRGWLVGKYDKNGDGKLDETERAAARADGDRRLRERAEQRLRELKALDTDGDGKFSDAEWAAAKEKFRAQLGRELHDEHHDGPPPPPHFRGGAGHEEPLPPPPPGGSLGGTDT